MGCAPVGFPPRVPTYATRRYVSNNSDGQRADDGRTTTSGTDDGTHRQRTYDDVVTDDGTDGRTEEVDDDGTDGQMTTTSTGRTTGLTGGQRTTTTTATVRTRRGGRTIHLSKVLNTTLEAKF